MKFSLWKTDDAWREAEKQWVFWFAWYPVFLDTTNTNRIQMAWLQTVERRATWVYSRWGWRCREILKTNNP